MTSDNPDTLRADNEYEDVVSFCPQSHAKENQAAEMITIGPRRMMLLTEFAQYRRTVYTSRRAAAQERPVDEREVIEAHGTPESHESEPPAVTPIGTEPLTSQEMSEFADRWLHKWELPPVAAAVYQFPGYDDFGPRIPQWQSEDWPSDDDSRAQDSCELMSSFRMRIDSSDLISRSCRSISVREWNELKRWVRSGLLSPA